MVEETDTNFVIGHEIERFLEVKALQFINRGSDQFESISFTLTDKKSTFYADERSMKQIVCDRRRLTKVFATVLWYC